MKANNRFLVVRDFDENGKDLFRIIRSDDVFKNKFVFCIDGYNHTLAGDYSLFNLNEPNAMNDLMNEGALLFGDDFRAVSICANEFTGRIDFEIPISLEYIYDRIWHFIYEWENKNAIYNEGDFYTYWDGNQNQTIFFRDDFNNFFHLEILEEDKAAPILAAWGYCIDFKKISPGRYAQESEGYLVQESHWDSDWGIATVQKMESCCD